VVAERLIVAMNQAADTPQLNRALAKVYASAASPHLMTRTWGEVMDAYAKKSQPSSRPRVERAFRSAPFKILKGIKVNETDAAMFLAVLEHKKAGNAANHYLRRLQNYAYAMRWLFEPIIPGPEWPKITKKTTYAISAEEHARIIASEQNVEHRLYYQMLWETGGSQSDIANLSWQRINEETNTIEFYRDKLNEREEDGEICGLSVLAIGPNIRAILNACPKEGYLFPSLRRWTAGHRTSEFARRCRIAGVKNRQMKGYRYAWAERACAAGMPERDAMNHLGHKSKAIHRAYAAKAKAVTLPLEHYEQVKAKKILAFQQEQAMTTEHTVDEPKREKTG
jgi:integrase